MPLALRSLLTAVVGLVTLVLPLLAGERLPLGIAATAAALLVASILRSWWQYGRHVISGRDLALGPLYALRKLPLYAGFIVSRQMEWVRSKRNGEP